MSLRIYIVECIDLLKVKRRFEIQALMLPFQLSFPPL